MADDDKTTDETTAGTGTTEGDQTTAEGQPHPLAAGGVRFEEVVSEKNRYKAEADTLRAQVAAFQVAQTQAHPATPQAEKVWSAQELQGLVDAARITPAQMSDQLSIQRSRESEERVMQRFQTERVLDSAQQDVNAFLRVKADVLLEPEVLAAAREIQQETGWRVEDPRLAKRALREVYGSSEKLAAAKKAGEFSRRNADTHVETGGTPGGPGPQGSKPTALKDIHPSYLEEWKRRGYTEAEMIEEAKYITRPFPGYRERIHGRDAQEWSKKRGA